MSAPPDRPARRVVDPLLGATLVVAPGVLLLANAAGPALGPERLPPLTVAVAATAGVLLSLLYRIGYRALGAVPVGLLVAVAHAAGMLIADARPAWAVGDLAFGLGLAGGAVLRYWATLAVVARRTPRADRRRLAVPGMDVALVLLVCWAAAGFAVAAATAILGDTPPDWWRPVCVGVLLGGGSLLTAYAWLRLFRPLFELGVEPLVRVGYRIRGRGPGMTAVPYHGPVLVIANHACWWDPLFLADVIPRPITPMMTSAFYDIWFLRPFMVHTFGVIRVAEVAVRRDAPEIREAVAALDAGKCVVIFPEGWLRRKDEQFLRRFGRGVWEILRERPDTPVVACWIEGGWGSWTSYRGGPPTVGKRPDVRRPIEVGVSAPTTVKPDVLAHHLRTRVHLMNEVLAARTHLGLPPAPPIELPVREDEGERGA
jgi:1-acyl-sn-glycerol-3-phosphate acyltransferase